jgi:hypothetical protein
MLPSSRIYQAPTSGACFLSLCILGVQMNQATGLCTLTCNFSSSEQLEASQQLAANSPATSQQPTANSQQPATSSQQPAANSQQPAASSHH